MKIKFISIFIGGFISAQPAVFGQHHPRAGIIYEEMIAPAGLEQEIVIMKLTDPFAVSNLTTILSNSVERNSVSSGGTNSPAAVPGNNDCASAITLTANAPCVNGTNKEANTQTGEGTSCQGAVTKTVWYKFVANSAIMYVEVERTASSGCYLSSAVYSGSCLPSASISCEDAAGGPNLNIHNLTALTIGDTYYIQVSYTAGGPCGNNNNANTGADFCIRVGNPVTCSTCTTTCGPACVFATTPTVAQVTGTCPAYNLTPRMNAGQSRTQCYTFTAIASSFSLQMIISSTGCGMGGNVSTFNWQLYPASCSGMVQSGTLSNLNASGLTIGSAYVLCYTWVSTCQHNTVYPYIVATSPLPVELINFDGKQTGNKVLLKWTTASEKGNDYFSIQHSVDGISFNERGKIKGAGNSTHITEYSFTDVHPVQGINYYRLTQSDFDGVKTNSEVVGIRFMENSLIRIENNPVKEMLQLVLQTENEQAYHFEVVNNLGETIIHAERFSVKGFNKFILPVNDLPDGMYFLKMESGHGITWTRFVKT